MLDRAPDPPREDDEPYLLGLAFFLGALRIAIAVATAERWGGEAGVAACFVVASIAGLARRLITRRA